ncbi:hypothetical protein [Amycolatopsis nigrescens]|uniref:hypothetical protein n=1 Tax=Amycolatopsis nigrescens TaxID=381445 RepID=UPI00036C55DA|nr:hypothetical protein [Amycolatopsis nigrescens]
MADRTLDKLPFHYRARRNGHQLCIRLDDLSKGLDPGTYAKLTQTPIYDGLLRLRFPKFLADVLSSTAAFGVKEILGALPPTHLSMTLSVLIPLVCPDLNACPIRREVLKTYASPALAEQLKTVAASIR